MATAPLSFSDRNALAQLAAAPALAPGALVYTPGKPQFSALVVSILGNAGTPSDGFDSIFAGIASIVEGDIAALSALDVLLTGIEFVPGALDSVGFSPIVKEYAPFVHSGDAQLGEVDNTAPPPPTKTKQPPPQKPMSAWQQKCRHIYPYGYDVDNPGLGDPCNP
jgi:hypothetical protein